MNIEKLNIIRKYLIPILLMVIAFIIGYLGLTEVERQTRQTVGNSINTVLQATNASHAVWIEENYSSIRNMAEKPEVVNSVMK